MSDPDDGRAAQRRNRALIVPYRAIGAGPVRALTDTESSRRYVRNLWMRGAYTKNSPAEAYFRRRGLAWLVDVPWLRYLARCPHPDGPPMPAVIALVLDHRDNAVAIQRTYIDRDGRKIANKTVKATVGAFSGGAVRIHPACQEMVIGEGIESSASAARVLRLPAWAAVSCGNLAERLILPEKVRDVTIAVDRDGRSSGFAGQVAAEQAAARWRAEGRQVRLANLDRPGSDFNDLLMERRHG